MIELKIFQFLIEEIEIIQNENKSSGWFLGFQKFLFLI